MKRGEPSPRFPARGAVPPPRAAPRRLKGEGAAAGSGLRQPPAAPAAPHPRGGRVAGGAQGQRGRGEMGQLRNNTTGPGPGPAPPRARRGEAATAGAGRERSRILSRTPGTAAAPFFPLRPFPEVPPPRSAPFPGRG